MNTTRCRPISLPTGISQYRDSTVATLHDLLVATDRGHQSDVRSLSTGSYRGVSHSCPRTAVTSTQSRVWSRGQAEECFKSYLT